MTRSSNYFLDWLRTRNVVLNGIHIAQSRAALGVIATRDLPVGHRLFKIARHLAIVPRQSLVGDAIAKWPRLLSSWTALALTIAYEKRVGDKSSWAGYLAFLPDSTDLPLLWDDAELQGLQGTGLCIRSSKIRCAVYYERYVLPFLTSHPYLFPSSLSLPQFMHFGALVSAYSFTVDEEVVMMPVADALNADGLAASNARLQQVDDGWEMVVTKAVRKGEELLNYYGSFAESESLLRYGYISNTDTPGTAISARELYVAAEKQRGPTASLHVSRLTLVLRKMAQSGIIVEAATEHAEPFMDCAKVLPLSNLINAAEELDRIGLASILTHVVADRLKLLDNHILKHNGSKRSSLAEELRSIDKPRLELARTTLASAGF